MGRLTNKRKAWAQRKDCENRIVDGFPKSAPEEGFIRFVASEEKGYTPEEITDCRWIPVTERLPEDGTPVLVNYIGSNDGKMMKVYIAGKITGDAGYFAKFAMAQAKMSQDGHIVLNPAWLPEGMTPQDYMRICFAMIDAADLCVFLPDWEESRGARLERVYCEYIGKKVVTWND